MKINKEKVLEVQNCGAVVVAATKYLDVDMTNELIDLGITNIGENRVDVLLNKLPFLHQAKIHFIGHLQRNKAKLIINKIDCLHSLDSLELAKIINDLRTEVLDCFIEVNLGEDSKNGVSIDLLKSFIYSLEKYDKINLLGLMGMAHKASEEVIRKDFLTLSNLNKEFGFKYLSMGMSDDYLIALEYGTTHIRLGRVLFLED